jgi:hypothetical protein
MRLIDRAGRTTTAIAVVAGSLLLGACSAKQELLAPQNPGVIDPGAVANTAAADALYVGALALKSSDQRRREQHRGAVELAGLFTDEFSP